MLTQWSSGGGEAIQAKVTGEGRNSAMVHKVLSIADDRFWNQGDSMEERGLQNGGLRRRYHKWQNSSFMGSKYFRQKESDTLMETWLQPNAPRSGRFHASRSPEKIREWFSITQEKV